MKITGILMGAAAGTLGLMGSAEAASFSLTDGGNLFIDVELTEVSGDIQFDVSVRPGGDTADLRGIFFDLANDALLSDTLLSATGDDVTDFDTGNVSDLGGGANMNGGSGPSSFDVGVEIGTSGANPDDIQSTLFVLSHDSLAISLDDLLGQNFGIRATSVGDPAGNRGDSVKLTTVVAPSPAAAGMGLALLGLGALRRVRRGA